MNKKDKKKNRFGFGLWIQKAGFVLSELKVNFTFDENRVFPNSNIIVSFADDALLKTPCAPDAWTRKIWSIDAAKNGGHSAASFCRSVLPSTLVRWVKCFVILPRRLKILRLKSKNISRQRVVSRSPTTECSLKRSDSCLSRNKRKKRVCAKLKHFILKLVHTMFSRLWRSGASWIWSTAEPFSVQKGSMR